MDECKMYLDNWKHRRHEIKANILKELLEFRLIGVGILKSISITLTLIPQKASDSPTVHQRSPSPPHHLIVKQSSLGPLVYFSPTNGTRNQPYDPVGGRILCQELMRKWHPWSNPIHLFHIDIRMEWLSSFFPGEVSSESENGSVWLAFIWDEAIPCQFASGIVDKHASTTGHVALSCQYKYVSLFHYFLLLGCRRRCEAGVNSKNPY